MIMIKEPEEVKVILLNTEIEMIIRELEETPYSIYNFFNYGRIIKKLNDSVKKGEKRK